MKSFIKTARKISEECLERCLDQEFMPQKWTTISRFFPSGDENKEYIIALYTLGVNANKFNWKDKSYLDKLGMLYEKLSDKKTELSTKWIALDDITKTSALVKEENLGFIGKCNNFVNTLEYIQSITKDMNGQYPKYSINTSFIAEYGELKLTIATKLR